jgi:hypothetical protein
MEEATILERFREVRRVPQGASAKASRAPRGRPKVTVREWGGIPVLCGAEKIPHHIRRGKRPKPPMAELGIEKLKPQQKLALQNKFELGMSNRQAAIQAGYEETNASRVLPRLLRRKPIVDWLEAKGVTDEKIAQVIAEAMEAKHPFRPKQPDHNIRLKAAHEANVAKDNYPVKKIEIEEKSTRIVLSDRAYEKYLEDKRMREEERRKLMGESE